MGEPVLPLSAITLSNSARKLVQDDRHGTGLMLPTVTGFAARGEVAQSSTVSAISAHPGMSDAELTN